MKWHTKGTIAVAALVAFTATDAEAQRQGRRGQGVRTGPQVERIMSMRDRLELTEDQIASLEILRRESVQERTAAAAEIEEMRSQLAAGQIQRSDMMAFMEDRRAASPDRTEEQRARIEGLLTEAQLGSLEELAQQRRSFARDRAAGRSMRGDRGGRPGAGFRRGGQGFPGDGSGIGNRRPRFRGSR